MESQMGLAPRIVDNRVFLLGLDQLYREAMKQHERTELLQCARDTANALGIPPSNAPVEGYYYEDEKLTEYFRWMRALQVVDAGRQTDVKDLPSFQRLASVIESGLFGKPSANRFLISMGRDPLTEALTESRPEAWNIESLTRAATAIAERSDDFSLVSLAALANDSLVLAALRETVVLYVAYGPGSGNAKEVPEYIWKVDERIQRRAARFISTFNRLFSTPLPEAIKENVVVYYQASSEAKILWRCVRIGFDLSTRGNYHWAIDEAGGGRQGLVVRDFWDTELWTTERYLASKMLNRSLGTN